MTKEEFRSRVIELEINSDLRGRAFYAELYKLVREYLNT